MFVPSAIAMESVKVAKLSDLLHSHCPLTATASPSHFANHFASASSPPRPPPTPLRPHDRRVLASLRCPTIMVGTLSLPDHIAPASSRCSCFRFSDESASVCCDLLEFQAFALGKRIRVTAWNFIPFKNHRGGRCGFLEIIKWCFLDPDEGLNGLNQMDSLPLVTSHRKFDGDSSKARYRVYGLIESVGPISIVPVTMVVSISEMDSSSVVNILGFMVQLMCCECRLCCSKELINDLESGNGHSFTRRETVYFCNASCWHPAMTKLIGHRVMLSRLKKKLACTTKDDSRVMHLTVDASVLHVCRNSKKWPPCLKSDIKVKGECGAYTGIIKGVFMQGMALELDHDVWLLLTDELHTLMHGFRVGTVISVRNVHFVDPQFSWTKIVILGACVKTSIIVESFSPLETSCNVVLKSQSMLEKFIQSLPFSARLWVLLLVSSLRKKFAGILSDKEILGSKHEEGLAQIYASSLFSPSVYQTEHGSFMGLRKHELNVCSTELHCNFLKLVIPMSMFICHCIDTLLRMLKSKHHCKSLPIGIHVRFLSRETRYNGRSVRRIISGKDVGVVLLGYLKINTSTRRLQLVDATGGIDVLIPDIPLTWNAEKIYEVTNALYNLLSLLPYFSSYELLKIYRGELVDHAELLEIESLSCRMIFDCTRAATELNNSIFVYFHWKNAKCRKLPLYPCIDKKNEIVVPEPRSYHLLRVSHKFPLQEKFSNNIESNKSNTFVEAKLLPFVLFLAGKTGISRSYSYNVSTDETEELSEYCISGNNEEQVSNKRQKLVKESLSSSNNEFLTSTNELRACSDSFKKSNETKKCVDLISSHDILCLVIFRSLQRENVVCPAVLHSTSPTKDTGFNSKATARKIFLEFSSDRFLTYQLLKIGDCYIIEHNTKDCFCTRKGAGFGSCTKFLVGSRKPIFSLSFISDEVILNHKSVCTSTKESSSPSIDGIMTKDQIEQLLLRSKVDSSDVCSDVCLYLPVNFTGHLEGSFTESVDSQRQEFAVSEESAYVSLRTGIVLGRPTLCSRSQNSKCLFPKGNLISLEGDVVDIHDIGCSFSYSCSSDARLDALQLKGRFGTRSSFCIHVLVHHHIVRISGSITKHAFPTGFGPGVTAKFHRILDARAENKFVLLPVSFIVIKSIKVCSDWSSNLSPTKDAYNASPDSISCLISQMHQRPSNKQIMLRCRVVAVFVLVLEKKTTIFDAETIVNDKGTAFDIPLAGFLLDDGSSLCCCWANAERAATLSRLHEEQATFHNIERILKKYQKITVKNHGSFIDFPNQDLAISVTSGNALFSSDENLLKFIIFNACVGRIWNVVASVMDVEEVRQLEKEYFTEMVNLQTMQNIWAEEVACPRTLADARNMIEELLCSAYN